MENEIASTVAKGGITRLSISMTRRNEMFNKEVKNKIGLSLNIKASPEVEDFMKNLGTGDLVTPTAGRLWEPIAGTERLYLWEIPADSPLSGLQGVQGSRYRIDAAGLRLVGQDFVPGGGPVDSNYVNLSFLRCAGISSENGVTIGIRTVHSKEYIQLTSKLITQAFKNFYLEYLKPYGITINSYSTEV